MSRSAKTWLAVSLAGFLLLMLAGAYLSSMDGPKGPARPPGVKGGGETDRTTEETPRATVHFHAGEITGIKPESSPVQRGQPYPFRVGHCGLRHLVDFDGSFWDVTPESMTEEEKDKFGINASRGTMKLVAENKAIYRDAQGGEADLLRHIGEATFFGCR